MAGIVLDTNIVLDLYVFNDPTTALLREQLETDVLRWMVTAPMREELERVLAYPKIAPRLAYYRKSAARVLEQMDIFSQTVPVAPKASVTCKDADDQKFVDLAVQHGCLLLSKDHAVLCMARRLQALGVVTRSTFDLPVGSVKLSAP